MHIVFFGDQHLDSLGGAQVSMRLQRQFLERAGHTVTVVAPGMRGPSTGSGQAAGTHSTDIDLPSMPITMDREYSMSWPGRATDRFLDRAMTRRPPVDIVHVQADFWGAFIGHRYAQRHGLPVVHTMHNRVDVGIAAVTPFPGPVLAVLNAWRRRAMRGIGEPVAGNDGWAFLRGLAAGASAVTAPSTHFARRLEEHDVFRPVDVIWNGIDDDLRAEILGLSALRLASLAQEPEVRTPRFVWLGRMSPEKRLLPFLQAFVAAGADAELEVIGRGGQRAAAEKIVAGMPNVRFAGRLTYPQTLARIAAADALVQTSIGFETQGMTPFEAATLGTPSVISDPDIAAELGGGLWAVPDPSTGSGTQPEAEPARIAALAQTLRQAASDIAAGTAPVPLSAVAEAFRQSSRTAAMIEVYERVLRQR